MSLLNPNLTVACSCGWETLTDLDKECEIGWSKTTDLDVICEVEWEKTTDLDKECESSWEKTINQDVICEVEWEKTTDLDKECEVEWSRLVFLDVPCEVGWTKGTVVDVICNTEYNEYEIVIGPVSSLGCETAWISTESIIMIKDDVTLIRVSDSQPIAIDSANCGIDINSWCWSFSANVLSRDDANYVRPTGSGPVEVKLSINEYFWHFIVEDMSENYGYGDGSYTIRGRSPSAVLAKPYAVLQTKTWDSVTYPLGVNAQQITGTELTPKGWFQDWNVVDWNIPGDIYSVKDKTIIEICAEVVQAAGGVIMTRGGIPTSEAYEKRLIFYYRYPTSPKNFGIIVPD